MGENGVLRYNYMIYMEKNTQQMPGQIFLSWTAPTNPKVERGTKWYLGTIMAISLLLLYSIWTQAWTFTLLIVLLTIILAWSLRKETPIKSISIGEYGIQMETAFIGWDDCVGYWLLQGPNYIELHFERNKGKPKYSKILIGDVDMQDIRIVLSTYTTELTDRIERPLDMLSRLLKI